MTTCPACFLEKGDATACDHCGWRPGGVPDNPLYLPLGTVLEGGYVIGRVLGHGGLGITYLARDRRLEIRVAIKEFLPDNIAGRNSQNSQVTVHTGQQIPFRHALDRFLAEARILARFDRHPGIVSVRHLFEANGTGYMVMEFVAGQTLRQYLETHGGRLPWRQAWALLGPLMDTLGQIHQTGLLHRDIAPDNIYLTQDKEIKLLDFGAAREVTAGRSVTLSVILKPGYAPAEQYSGAGRQQGPWTDIYALSATLYRTITGQLPVTSVDRLIEDNLPLPGALGIAIPKDHEAVLMKGLAIRAEERWQTIGEMQAAWRAAEGEEPEPGPEPPPPPPPPPPSWDRRIAVLGVVIAALALILQTNWTDLTNWIDRVFDIPSSPVVETERSKLPAPTGTNSNTDNVWLGSSAPGASPQKSSASDASGQQSTALQHEPPARQAPSQPAFGNSLPPSTGGERLARSTPATPTSVEPIAPPSPATLVVELPDHPDATVILNDAPMASPGAARALNPGPYTVGVQSPGYLPFQEELTLTAGEERTLPVRLQPKPARLVVRSNVTGDTVYLDDQPVGPSGPEAHALAPGEYTLRVEKAGFAPFEQPITLEPGGARTIKATLEPAKTQLLVAANVPAAKVFVDGQLLGRTGAGPFTLVVGEHTVRVEKEGFDPVEQPVTLVAETPASLRVELEPAKARLVVTANTSGARVFLDGKPLGAAGATPHAVAAGEYTLRVEKAGYEDFQQPVTLTAGKEQTVRAILKRPAPNYANWRQLWKIEAHSSAIAWPNGIRFSPDGHTLLTGSWDGTLKLWAVAGGKPIRAFTGHSADVNGVAFAPDGRRVASGSDDTTLKLWNVASGKAIRTLKGHSSTVWSVAFAPDGQTVLSGSSDNKLKLWTVAGGPKKEDQSIRTFTGHSGPVTSVAFAPDGQRVASGSRDNTLKLWAVASGEEIRTLKGHSGYVLSVAFAPDGQTVLSGSRDSKLKLWAVAGGPKKEDQSIRTFSGHSGAVLSVAFAPDGRTVLSGSGDNTVRLWNVASGRETRKLEGHASSVWSVAFSPDGRRAASGDRDGTLILWGEE
uniref:PEGA domain-containing protein n=1 Tax=Candidatus Kentrum sp. FM TaxID=2126340 RepID=A0A450SQV2_9GAMM|nr:MAG: PEGA domain-containing protein [Candidatus Kentron sp. FM]VFJ56404.1 MAG: PEGA domain-containing protein [Candidatus Kentron sp. FM]VFK10821.1 MAG: PEGA domain-containing protein [Candidatus Kentron sp. FM]